MQYRLLTFILGLVTFLSASAKSGEPSVLDIRLSDDSPLVVVINNRQYDKFGSNITIGNLPKGWHNLRVYEYLEYKKGGGRAKLLYSGNIRVKSGKYVNCVVDVRSSRMRTNVMDIDEVPIHQNNTIQDMSMPVEGEEKVMIKTTAGGLTAQGMNDLRRDVLPLEVDVKKMNKMKQQLANEKYTSSQLLAMLDWLAFESSRLAFAKWSYSRVTDTENYPMLDAAFTLESSKEELQEYITQQE